MKAGLTGETGHMEQTELVHVPGDITTGGMHVPLENGIVKDIIGGNKVNRVVDANIQLVDDSVLVCSHMTRRVSAVVCQGIINPDIVGRSSTVFNAQVVFHDVLNIITVHTAAKRYRQHGHHNQSEEFYCFHVRTFLETHTGVEEETVHFAVILTLICIEVIHAQVVAEVQGQDGKIYTNGEFERPEIAVQVVFGEVVVVVHAGDEIGTSSGLQPQIECAAIDHIVTNQKWNLNGVNLILESEFLVSDLILCL